MLLGAGRANEAETVYWQDLERRPDNGWALGGLVQALGAQDKQDEARAVDERFRKAWSRADMTLAAVRWR